MNFPPLSARSAFIEQLDLASTVGSQAWKASTNSSFPQRYRVQVFQVCSHMRMAEYVFPEREGGLCGPHKSACTSSSLLVVTVMLLFRLTTRVDLLPTHGVHNLLRSLGFSALFSWQTAIIGIESEAMRLLVFGVSLSESESEVSELSESMSTSTESYLLLEVSRLIPSVSLDALMTRALLACANLRCHTLMRLFRLTR